MVAQVLVVTARVVELDPLEEVDAVVAAVVSVVTSVLVDAAVVEAVSPVGSVSDVIV